MLLLLLFDRECYFAVIHITLHAATVSIYSVKGNTYYAYIYVCTSALLRKKGTTNKE